MINANTLHEVTTCVNGKWYVAKPFPQPLKKRIKDALQVVLGRAEAVVFEIPPRNIKPCNKENRYRKQIIKEYDETYEKLKNQNILI